MSKYVYQKFLLNCNYEDMSIKDFPTFEGDVKDVQDYRCDYCLFDVGRTLTRKISAVDIDEQVDTEEDWNQLIKVLKGFDVIVLYDYTINSTNPIIQNYRDATLRAYLYRLKENRVNVYLA